MNNLKKAGVMFLIATLTISMVLVPFTPMTSVSPVADPRISTPEEVMMDLERYLDTRNRDGPLDSILASYRDSGVIASDVVRNHDGDVGVLIVLDELADLAGLEEIVTVNWMVSFNVAIMASAYVRNVESLVALENYEGVVTAFADRLYREKTNDFATSTDSLPPTSEPDAWATLPWIGIDTQFTTDFPGIDGTGIRIGAVDSGTDFSHPDLYGAIDIGSDGLPTSFDPTGYGFGVNLYRANATPVENVTAWLDYSSWNLLSYKGLDGNWYLNWSSMNANANYVNGNGPRVNNQGGLVNLDWYFDGYVGAWWGPTATNPTRPSYPNQGNLTDFYYDVMRQDPQIPDPSYASGGSMITIEVNTTSGATKGIPYYCTGYTFQQRNDPYVKVFAPTMVLNNTILVVDWNTTRAHTAFWNDAIRNSRYVGIDFNDTANWDHYEGLGDWSFVDDLEQDLTYWTTAGTADRTVLKYTYPTDSMTFGLGTLCRGWEGNIFGLGMVNGIGLSGRALSIMYDGDSHGTFVSGQIAGRGVLTYPVGPGGSMVALPGVAPGSTIMGVMTAGIVSEFQSMLYAAGFDYNGTNYANGWWNWNYDSVHRMDITSNSWGWVSPQYIELWGIYSLIYAAIATPGFFNATHYPGQIIVFSAGNAGPGYGTAGPPSVPQTINVGASTSYHTFEGSYGPDQGFDQIASFSSRGPSTLGYSKPDILAPGANNYGLVPDYGDMFYAPQSNYAIYGGTSMACPLVTGVAALMLDADSALDPDEVKTIMMSTAVDIGIDGLTQGAGRIDAYAALDYVVNGNGNVFSTMDSMANWAVAIDEAWEYDMAPYTRNTWFNSVDAPTDFADYSLYFGIVNEGDSVTMTVNTDGNWAFSDFTWSAETYVAASAPFTFSFETYIYNDTVTDSTKAGWIDLEAKLGTTDFNTLMGYQYATITIAGDQTTFADDSLWAFIFDWDDSDPADGYPNYYNGTHGDELTRLQYADDTNVLKMVLSSATILDDLFTNTAIIMVHDDNIWSWPYTSGNTLQVTIQPWVLTSDSNIGTITDAGPGATVPLTVGAGTDYGIHQGFIIADNATGTNYYRIPYTYNVIGTYDTEGAIMEIANGIGDVQTPYEQGTITANTDPYYTYQAGDHASIIVNVTDDTVNFLAARVTWASADTDMDVDITDMTGWAIAESYVAVKETDTSALAVAEIGGWTGLYIIYLYVNAMEGTFVPEDIVVTVVGLTAIDDPTMTVSYYARDHPVQTAITSGGSAVGDHVILNATWADGVNPGMPELSISSLEMKILYGTFTDETVAAVDTPDPDTQLGGGVINPDEWAFVTAPGIVEGDFVRITVDFDGGDGDAAAWWSDTPMEERTYTNRIGTHQSMASGRHPEYGEFTATRSGSIDVGCLNYDGASTEFHVIVDTRVGLEPDRVYTNTFEIDTYDLLFNGTFAILLDSDTGSNLRYTASLSDVFIGNYFVPVVTVNPAIVLTDHRFNFTWTASDLNLDDTLYFSVWISSDGGSTFQLLRQNLTDSFYVWNSAGWLEQDYVYRVRVYDLDFTMLVDSGDPLLGVDGWVPLNGVDTPPSSYWPGYFSDGVSGTFEAGDQIYTPPTTTTTTTPPPTTPPPPPPVIDPLLIGLLGGLGIGVVVLLILFLIRKR